MGYFRPPLRALRRHPGTSAAALFSLTIGIILCTTMFSVVDWLWLNASPFGQPKEVVRVFTRNQAGELASYSWPAYQQIRRQATSLEGLTSVEHRGALFESREGISQVLLADITDRNFFEVMRLVPAAGVFYAGGDDAERVAAAGVVISYGLWQRAFGADPATIGGPITLSGRPHTLLGVTPQGFTGINRLRSVDVWFPPRSWGDPEQWTGEFPSFALLGRTAPGTDLRQVRAEMRALVARLDIRDMATRAPVEGVVMTDAAYHAHTYGRTGGLLMALVGAVLIIACANVAGLLLARALVRQREMAIRTALGGSRSRLMRQLLAEGLVLALGAAACGLGGAALLLHLLPGLLPPQPTYMDWGFALNGRGAGFALLLSLATVLLFGLLPALRASRPDLVAALKGEGPSAGARGSALSGLRAVVVVQLALSLVLASTTGLLLRSYLNTQSADLGHQRRDMLIACIVPLMENPHPFFEQLTEQVAALPGIRRAVMARHVPFYPSGGGASLQVHLPEGEQALFSPGSSIKFNLVGPEYFELMGIPLLAGRAFSPADRADAPGVAVVNQTFAAGAWPGQAPLGRTFQSRQTGTGPVTVVGMVPDGTYNRLNESPEPYIYLPFAQMPWGEVLLLAETEGPPEPMAPAVRDRILATSDNLFLLPMDTHQGLFRNATYSHQILALVLGVFTLLGLLLAAVGLYGVSLYSVNRRLREIGIRMALGADSGRIMRLVVGQGGRLILVGLTAGVPLTIIAALLLRGTLYGVSPLDPLILITAALVLAGITLVATSLPGRQALKVDPLQVMRQE